MSLLLDFYRRVSIREDVKKKVLLTLLLSKTKFYININKRNENY